MVSDQLDELLHSGGILSQDHYETPSFFLFILEPIVVDGEKKRLVSNVSSMLQYIQGRTRGYWINHYGITCRTARCARQCQMPS